MVVGFMFYGERVLLVRKTRPAWQSGLWNGVGGVVEKNETSLHAMTREFNEEVGHLTLPGDWTHYCTEHEPFGAVVHFFWAMIRARVSHILTPTHNDANEELAWFNVSDLGVVPVLGNLRWLVPLALDWRGVASPVIVRSVGDIREKASW
jgi:8-oxo-dGTP diphosphatase